MHTSITFIRKASPIKVIASAIIIIGSLTLFGFSHQAQAQTYVPVPVTNSCFSVDQGYAGASTVRGVTTSIVLHNPANDAITKNITVINQNPPSIIENISIANPNSVISCPNSNWLYVTGPPFTDGKRLPLGAPTAYNQPSNGFAKVIVNNFMPSSMSEDPLAYQWQVYKGSLPPYNGWVRNMSITQEDSILTYIFTNHYLQFIGGGVTATSQNAEANLPMTNCAHLSGTGTTKVAILRSSQSPSDTTLNNFLWNADNLRTQINNSEYSFYVDLLKHDWTNPTTVVSSCGSTDYTLLVSAQAPTLTSVTATVQVGATISITGSGFSATNNVVRLTNTASSQTYDIKTLSSASNGTTISATIPATVPAGSYTVSARAAYTWWSNTKPLTINNPNPVTPPSSKTLSLTAKLQSNGKVNLTWPAKNPDGGVWNTIEIYRAIDKDSTSFQLVTQIRESNITGTYTDDLSKVSLNYPKLSYKIKGTYLALPYGLATNIDSDPVQVSLPHTKIIALELSNPGFMGNAGVSTVDTWMKDVNPDSETIPWKFGSVAKIVTRLRQDIDAQLLMGNKVLVVAISGLTFPVFNMHHEYDRNGKNVQFLYVDPPYKTLLAGLANNCVIGHLGGMFSSVYQAMCPDSTGVNVVTSPDTINWTDGKALGWGLVNFKYHNPFDFPSEPSPAPNGKTNGQNLLDLHHRISSLLYNFCTTSCSFDIPSSVGTLVTAPQRIKLVSSSGANADTIQAGDTVTVAGSGFDANSNNIYIENQTNPNIYYVLFDVPVEASSGHLKFQLPATPIQDSDNPISATPGKYSFYVSTVNSDWSNPITANISTDCIDTNTSQKTGNKTVITRLYNWPVSDDTFKAYANYVINNSLKTADPSAHFYIDMSSLTSPDFIVRSGNEYPGAASDDVRTSSACGSDGVKYVSLFWDPAFKYAAQDLNPYHPAGKFETVWLNLYYETLNHPNIHGPSLFVKEATTFSH